MRTPDRGQCEYAESAAAFALNALEPADERRFAAHAACCTSCRRATARFGEVTQALAELAPRAEPASDLGAAIVRMAEGGRPSRTGQLKVVRDAPAAASARPASRLVRTLLTVAAAVVLAASGIWAVVSRGQATPTPPGASCAAASRCHHIRLNLAGPGGRTAAVQVRHGSVWLLPGRLPPDQAASKVYVLWQITAGARSPTAVGSFDVRAGSARPIRIGALPRPYPATRAFAVSLEPGRMIPARPSRLVAFGLVST